MHYNVQTLLPTLSARQVVLSLPWKKRVGDQRTRGLGVTPFLFNLVSTETSEFHLQQPTLRRLALSTLRHLIEKDPVSNLTLTYVPSCALDILIP